LRLKPQLDTAINPGCSKLLTMMFTDLVGSTELKDRLRTTGYLPLIARHDQLLREAVANVGGSVLQDTGDGCFAVFTAPSDAVRAALDFQWSMERESWPDDVHPRSRIGIHLGEVAETDIRQDGGGKLVGMPIDLTSRVMSLAHGGQILVTREAFNSARQFVAEHPRESSLPLHWGAHGPYLFKGTDEPLDVFEVGIDRGTALSPPPDCEKARRAVRVSDESTLGWRPAIGRDLLGQSNWVFRDKLGEGGFGEVWLAEHKKAKTLRVFKFCFDADRLRGLKREVALFRLIKEALGDRRDIARVIDWHLEAAPYFIEMEYTPEGNLADWAEKFGGIKEIPAVVRVKIVAGIAEALAAAHSIGVLHKDVKPSNVLMVKDDTGHVYPRLTDFGIGILTDRSRLEQYNITPAGFTASNLMMNDSSRTGTRMYCPPEAQRAKPHTVQGDVYALGVMLYQLAISDLTTPLGVGWERNVHDELLREDIAACVEGDPDRRLASAQALADRLNSLDARRLARDREVRLRVSTRRRNRIMRLAIGGAIVLAVLTSLTGIGLLRERSLRNRAEQAEKTSQRRLLDALLAGGNSGLSSHQFAQARASYVGAWDAAETLSTRTDAATNGVLETLMQSPPPLVGPDQGGLGFGVLEGLLVHVAALHYAPAGKRLYSGGEDKTLREWDSVTGRLLRLYSENSGQIIAVAVSPDGKTLASASDDGKLRLWDTVTGSVRLERRRSSKLLSVAFSPNGEFLVWSTEDGNVGLYDVTSLTEQWVTKHSSWTHVAFSSDGERIVSAARDSHLHFIDLKGNTIQVIRAGDGWTTEAAFSPMGDLVAAAGWTHGLVLVDTRPAGRVRRLAVPPVPLRCVAYSPDGLWVATGCANCSIYVFDVATGVCSATLRGRQSPVLAVRFAPDGRSLASSSEDGTIEIWPLPRHREGFGHVCDGRVVDCLPGDRTILIGDEGPLRIVDLGTGQTLKTLSDRAIDRNASNRSIGPRKLAVSADGRNALEYWMGNFNVHDLKTLKMRALETPSELRDQEVTSIAISAQGLTGMATFNDLLHSVVAWNLATGQVLTKWNSGMWHVSCGAISNEGRWLLAGGSDKVIKRWEINQLQSSSLPGVRADVYTIALSSNECRLLSGGLDRQLSLWDIPSQRRIAYGPSTEYIYHVAITQDGSTGAAFCDDRQVGKVRLWDLTGEVRPLGALSTGTGIHSLSLSSSGQVVAVAKRGVHVWELGLPAEFRSVARRLQARRASLDNGKCDGPAFADLGTWHAIGGNDNIAIECFDRAAKLGTSVPSLVLAQCLWRRGLDDRAHVALEEAKVKNEAPADYLASCREALLRAKTTDPHLTVPDPLTIGPGAH
jgi:WD40 repeat protein/class 3 adenylate cyclase/serine/threonine protein kinase